MGSNATEHDVRQLPIYRDGFSAGRDVGLVIALNVVTKQQARLNDELTVETVTGTTPDRTRTLAYATGQLDEVGRLIASAFRRATR